MSLIIPYNRTYERAQPECVVTVGEPRNAVWDAIIGMPCSIMAGS